MEVPLKPIVFALALAPLLAPAKVTYDEHVLPIFEQSCLNCHNPDKTKGGLDLSTFNNTLKGGSGGKVVAPQDTSSSLLAVVKHSSEPTMPPEGDPLSKDRIAVLEAWVAGGLLENDSSTARKPSKPKFDLTLDADPSAKPDGPPPMPEHVVLEPAVTTARASAIPAMACSPWAPLLAVAGQRQVLLFHTTSLELVGVLPFPEGDPVSLAFTPNGRYLIVGGGIPGKSGTTVTFDVTDGRRILTAGREFDTVIAADLHPSLETVATGSPARLIKIWKTEDGSRVASIKKHTDWITALDFSPDGILLATGDRNGGVWVWEAETGNEFHTLRGHQAGITELAFRTDSNVMASASEDGTVRFWEMNQGKEIRKLDAHRDGVLAFSWARDGSFATAGRDRKVRLWKPDFGQRREIKDLADLPTSLALDAEGQRVFIGDYRGVIAVHEVASGVKVGEFNSNPPSIGTRLAKLEEAIRKHPSMVASAREKFDQAKAKLAKLDQGIAKLRQAEKESKEAIRSTERELKQIRSRKPLEAETESSAVARLEGNRKSSSDLAKKLAKQRESRKPLRESVEKAEAELKRETDALVALETNRNRWQAADLNARSSAKAREAQALELSCDAVIGEFHQAARELESARAELVAKRKELAAVNAKVENAEPPALKQELAAVLAALRSVIEKEENALIQQQDRLLEARKRLDEQLPEATMTRAESERLGGAYRTRLKSAP